MKAALVLTLQDKLTAGLDRIKTMFDQIKKLGSGLSLGKLENAGQTLREIGREALGVATGFGRIQAAADRAGASIKKGWAASKEWGSRTFGAQSRLGAFGAAAEGYSLFRPMHAYAEIENSLRHSAITKNLSGPAVDVDVARMLKFVRHDALTSGQTSASVAKAFQDLLNQGLSVDDVELNLPFHTRVATAYNQHADILGPVSASLMQTMKVNGEDFGRSLTMLALAAKEGRVKMENFAHDLPGVAGMQATLGMTGVKGVATAGAALEIIARNTTNPEQAATYYTDMLAYLTSPIAAKSFSGMAAKRGVGAAIHKMAGEATGTMHQVGINLPKLLVESEKKGIDPVTAVIEALKDRIKGKTPIQAKEILSPLQHNLAAGAAMNTLLMFSPQFYALRDKLLAAGLGMLDRDFVTAFDAPKVKMTIFEEHLKQLQERVGKGFMPLIRSLNSAFGALGEQLDRLDDRFPGLGDAVLLGVGGLLLFSAVLAAIGFVLPALGAGFGMLAGIVAVLASPFGLVIAALAALAAAAYIYRDEIAAAFNSLWETLKFHWIEFIKTWQQYFEEWGIAEKFRAVKESVGGAVLYLKQQFDAATTAAGDMFRALNDWDGGVIGRALKGLVEDLKAVLAPFKAIEDIAGRIGSALKIHPDAADPATDLPAFDVPGGASPRGSFVVPKQETLRGEIVVTAGPGTTVTGIKSDRAMEIRIAPDSGLVAGRH